METIYRGAEANLYLRDGKLIKERIRKKYRVTELDKKLRKTRTKRESLLLDKARRAGLHVPRIYQTDEKRYVLVMEYLNAATLKEVFDRNNEFSAAEISKNIGECLTRMHNANIIHNDLTTSNMILKDDKIYLIDFGLGTQSTRIEDKAVDLLVLKKSLKASHSNKFNELWGSILAAYKETKNYREILARVKAIEKRARYT